MIQDCVDQAISLFQYEKFILLAKQIGNSEEYKKYIPQKLQNIAACFIEFLFQT